MNTDLSTTARALFFSVALSTKPALPPMSKRLFLLAPAAYGPSEAGRLLRGQWSKCIITSLLSRAWLLLFLLLRRRRLRSLRRIFRFRLRPPARGGYAKQGSRGVSGLWFSIFVLVASKGCKPWYRPRFKEYGKSQPLRALCFSFSRYRLNRLSSRRFTV